MAVVLSRARSRSLVAPSVFRPRDALADYDRRRRPAREWCRSAPLASAFLLGRDRKREHAATFHPPASVVARNGADQLEHRPRRPERLEPLPALPVGVAPRGRRPLFQPAPRRGAA